MTDGNLDNTVRSPGGLSEGAGLRLLYWAIFLFLGAYGNFFPLWLDSAGWTESQMGWLDGMRYACLIVFPLIWGHITDKSGRPVQTIRWIALGSCAAFFFTLWTSAFVPLMITMVVFSAFRVGIVPVTDTFTLSHVERAGGEYGRIRIWGSLGFIVGGFGAAWVIAGTSRASVPNILVALLVATVIVAAILPNRPFLASMQRANTGFRRLWSSSALRRFMVVVLSILAAAPQKPGRQRCRHTQLLGRWCHR
jgi:PPP family 3-phenylpropionic acid transporter